MDTQGKWSNISSLLSFFEGGGWKMRDHEEYYICPS